MSDVTTVAQLVLGFYRLLGVKSGDGSLTRRGEAADDIAYHYLTRGARRGQRYMLGVGYDGWRKRSAALEFSGSDDADGGQYTDLPTDFLRAYGNERRSALVEPDGKRWGSEIDPEMDHLSGDRYYIRGDELWLARRAVPPATLYLDYHYHHPAIAEAGEIDFPLEARPLIIAEAADLAKEESWVPGGRELKFAIQSAVFQARQDARDVARPTKKPRTLRKPRRIGNHY